MDGQGSSSSLLPPDDFRVRRDYLPDEAFALVTGTYAGATDLMPEGQWRSLMDLPTDVLLRTTDQCGTPLVQMHLLWETWMEALPAEADAAPYMCSAAWDASDDFNAATFTAAHGYYRQGMANLRSALEGLTAAASFAVRQDDGGLQRWLGGQSDPPRPVEARRILAPAIGTQASEVLRRLYGELSGYVHSQPGATNGVLWNGSNGPVFERDSFWKVYNYFRDAMAMGFFLLSIGWTEFTIPDQLWLVFERPNGAWASVSLPDLKQRLLGDDDGR